MLIAYQTRFLDSVRRCFRGGLELDARVDWWSGDPEAAGAHFQFLRSLSSSRITFFPMEISKQVTVHFLFRGKRGEAFCGISGT